MSKPNDSNNKEHLEAEHIETEVFGDQKVSGELELLRSRVEEQGKLICFLKRRTDDQLDDNKNLSGQYEKLQELKEETDEDLENLRTHCAMLENRFDELAENHDEMIKIKDEYKSRCKDLQVQNKRLAQENKELFSAEICRKENELIEIKKQLDIEREKVASLTSSQMSKISEFQTLNGSLKVSNTQLLKELSELQVNLKNTKEKLNSMSNTQLNTLSNETKKYSVLLKEKEDLVKEVMSRGHLVQEKQSTIEKLQTSLSEQQNEMSKLKVFISQKEHSLSVNKKISALTKEKEAVVKELKSLQVTFKALQDHSSQLLSRERSLNKLLSCGVSRKKLVRMQSEESVGKEED